jgi:hypothetical protein
MDDEVHRHTGQGLLESFIPRMILGFADGKSHRGHARRGTADDVRSGQFDHAPNAAGPQMVMNDDKSQVAVTVFNHGSDSVKSFGDV